MNARKMLRTAAVAAAVSLTTCAASADVYLVETNPGAVAPYGSWATAATTLADALPRGH